MSVILDSTLQIQCFVRGFPKLEVNWTNDGKLLDTRNTLTINRVSYGDTNTNAALKAVKGKMKQLFILQLQVNVDLLFFVLLLLSFSVVLFKLSPFRNFVC